MPGIVLLAHEFRLYFQLRNEFSWLNSGFKKSYFTRNYIRKSTISTSFRNIQKERYTKSKFLK